MVCAIEKYEVFNDEMDIDDLIGTSLDKNTRADIVLLAKVGCWDGNKYFLLNVSEKENTKNIRELVTRHLMRCDSDLSVYANDEDVIATETHHDGTNKYWYRQATKASYKKLMKLQDDIFDGAKFDANEFTDQFLSLTKPLLIKKNK